jgi:hypothetical protein
MPAISRSAFGSRLQRWRAPDYLPVESCSVLTQVKAPHRRSRIIAEKAIIGSSRGADAAP